MIHSLRLFGFSAHWLIGSLKLSFTFSGFSILVSFSQAIYYTAIAHPIQNSTWGWINTSLKSVTYLS